MFESEKLIQSGEGNQQAKRDINNITHIYNENDISFDYMETEKIIDDLYNIAKTFTKKEEFTFKRMKIEDKNKINKMEEYFESKIKQDIVYFAEIGRVLELNEDDFRERFKYIIGTIKGAILAIDNKEDLTPIKINMVFKIFYNQKWDVSKKLRAERLIHFMYFMCFIGKKKTK